MTRCGSAAAALVLALACCACTITKMRQDNADTQARIDARSVELHKKLAAATREDYLEAFKFEQASSDAGTAFSNACEMTWGTRSSSLSARTTAGSARSTTARSPL